MGKAVIIMILGSIGIFGIVNLTVNSRLSRDRDNAVDHFSNVQLRNICNSTAEIIMSRLGNNYYYRVNTAITETILGGTTKYTVKDVLVNGDSLIRIQITGTFGKRFAVSGSDGTLVSKTITLDVAKRFPAKFPTIPGTISARNLVEASGTFVIDGRDHDLFGALIANSGTFGIWTMNSFNQVGSCKVGGTASAIDYVPKKPGDPAIIKTNQVWTGGPYPTTPDEVLGGISNGIPEGALKTIAMSGVGGSQYTTNPASLSNPLKGVTYVELPIGGTWSGTDISGSGILIVHNSARDAALKNINSGNFTGLIIGNDVIRINSTIIGSLFLLCPNPSEGNFIGLGNGQLLFSRKAVEEAINFIAPYVHDYGFAKHRLVVKNWYE